MRSLRACVCSSRPPDSLFNIYWRRSLVALFKDTYSPELSTGRCYYFRRTPLLATVWRSREINHVVPTYGACAVTTPTAVTLAAPLNRCRRIVARDLLSAAAVISPGATKGVGVPSPTFCNGAPFLSIPAS